MVKKLISQLWLSLVAEEIPVCFTKLIAASSNVWVLHIILFSHHISGEVVYTVLYVM